MVFEQLPKGVIVVLLAMSCAIKHLAVTRMVYTSWYQKVVQKPQWYWAGYLSSLMGGVLTYFIFERFVGWVIALVFSCIDFLMYLGSKYLARRLKLFDRQLNHLDKTVIMFRLPFVVMYIVYIWVAFSYL